MNVTYKIRVNRPCKLFIDQEETQILDELDLVKIQLPKGEYLRKVISIDDSSIFDEAIIVLDGSSKIDIITLDTKGLDAAKANALPNTKFKIGNMYYQASIDKCNDPIKRSNRYTMLGIIHQMNIKDYQNSLNYRIKACYELLNSQDPKSEMILEEINQTQLSMKNAIASSTQYYLEMIYDDAHHI